MSKVEAIALSFAGYGDSEEGKHPKVGLSPATLDLHLLDDNARTRVSLLFPVRPERFKLPSDDRAYIGFFVHPSPLKAINGLELSARDSLLFGYGLASIVSIAEREDTVRQIATDIGSEMIAAELWTLEKGLLAETRTLVRPKEIARAAWQPVDQSKLRDPAVRWLISELNMNLKRYARLASLYNQQALPEFDELMSEVNDLARELLALETAQYRGPGTPEGAAPPAMETKRRWDAAVDWLVQANSSLVYAITQAFHAALPSRFERGLISQDSLLGTGTAWRAILRVYLDIKSVFRENCLPLTIQEQFANLPAVWTDQLNSYQATRKLPLSVHERGTDPREKGMSPKVVHFSSRLGFGESVTAVTCPSQTLQTCDSAQWSLVTVTHEMLHSHVRDIFAAIFTRHDAEGRPLSFDDSVRLAIDEYDAYKAGRADANANLLVSLRFLLIEYALDYRGCLEKLNQRYFPSASSPAEGAEEEEVDVLLPNRAKTLTAFRKAHRFTEEVIIHVLDLIYFYRGDSALFVDSLWNTWATVPSIVNKLNWYILRTVLAVSSLHEGGAFERLDFAVKVMIDRLKRMQELGRGTEITEEVIHRIEEPGYFKTWLEMLFPPSLKIVDLAAKILRSEKIEAELFSHGDKLVQFNNDQLEYLLETESFDENGVKSPVAFIFDRMRKAAASKEIVDPIASARRACWVLFAASSEPEVSTE